jgi:hypothetical protein
LLFISSRCFGQSKVRGCNLVAYPAHKSIAFIISEEKLCL